METEVNIPFITSDASGPKHLNVRMSRAQLERLIEEMILKSLDITKAVVKDAKFEISDIDEVVLVGGQTKMPLIQDKVKELFGKEPHKGINPDEVVATGAAVQAGILQGDVKDVLLLDVTPLTLGIETMGAVATPLISKNTTVPVKKSQTFSTAADSQPSVEIHIVQGDRPMAADNKTLGRFILDGLPPAPRGVPQIEVSFDIDANGILEVTALDKATNKKQSIRIEASSGLSKEDIEKMRQDAEKFATEDAKKKDLIELRNQADTTVYTTEKTLRDFKDKIKDEQKKELEEKKKALEEALKGEDLEAIKSKTQELSQSLQKIGQELYKENPQPASPEGEKGQEQKPEEEKKDDDKPKDKKDEDEKKDDEDKDDKKESPDKSRD